jgi:hypothetical protein
MVATLVCPSCGQSEQLRGTQTGDGIQVTCLACGATWTRGGMRCAACGAHDIVRRPQAMTRQSRGNQLSIVGWREVPLCRTCDADALNTSIARNLPIPGDYVAACLGINRAANASDSPQHPPRAAPAPNPPTAVKTQSPHATRASRTAPTPPPPAAKTASPPAAAPTVRHAVAAFMNEAPGHIDAAAMLLLATHLGPANRLTVLEHDAAAEDLASWACGYWGDGTDRAQRALSTIRRAIDFWSAQGWLSTDPAARLR